MKEMYMDATGNLNERGPIFAFGTHPNVTSPDEAHPVTSAKATDNKLRVIMDELLVGNYLEEVQCRGQVDTDAYDTVPIGATPDDIARCSVAKDVLPSSCRGTSDHAICICKNDGGCGEVANGEPVGVLDVNQDGAADDTRLIPGAIGVRCGTIDVPIDLNNSYWNPSGDQNVPAMGGFDALGPALVVMPCRSGSTCEPALPATFPMGTHAFLPTNTKCTLVFAPDVVDKQNNQVCAPPDGDVTKNCSPGDVAAFGFDVEPLRTIISPINDGDTGVSRTDPLTISSTAPIDPATITSVTVTEGTTAYTAFTLTQPSASSIRITWTAATGLAANQQYTVTVGTGLKDLFGQPIPTAKSYSFTTGM